MSPPLSEMNGKQSSIRSKTEEILAAEFIDTYEPPHQLGPDHILPAESFKTCHPNEPVKLRLAETGPASRKPISIVTFMRQTVERYPNRAALSVEREGKWIHWTYEDYWNQTHTVAKAFMKLGLERFHSVAVLGFNAPEWFLSSLGTIFAGGISTGIYSTNSPSACEYILKHSRANIVVVDKEVQLNKILQVRSNLPHLKAIIQYTGKPTHEDVLSWEDVMNIGRTVPDEALQKRIRSLAVNQSCATIYTSGTTGTPKAVLLTHDNYVYLLSEHATSELDLEDPTTDFSIVSYLPLNHIAGQIIDFYGEIFIGGHVYFARPDAFKGSLIDTLQAIRPTSFGGVPRIFEKMKERIEEKISTRGWFTKSLISWSMECVRQAANNKLNGNAATPLGYKFARRIVQKLRQKIGLERAERYGCGSAHLSIEVIDFFLGLDMPVVNSYGLSESTGAHLISSIHEFRSGSVGKPTNRNETKIVNCDPQGQGEVCLRGRNIFAGYMFDEENSSEALDEDGWLHTGDIGYFDQDGFLYITGRIKELIITAGGENIAPVPIEKSVKSEIPLVSEAVLIGDQRKFLSMLLTIKTNINMDTFTPLDTLNDVSLQWCKNVAGSSATTVQEILKGPDQRVMDAIQRGIDRVNADAISNACKIQKWIILPQDFSLQTDEMSPTMKLKRHVINQKYKDLIDKFYT